MKTDYVIAELKRKYPGKTIIENKNDQGVTTEIICEIDLTQDHPEWSRATAVIDSSVIHYHQRTTETYTVLKGILTIFKYDQTNKQYAEHLIKKGESVIIQPGEIHSNLGHET
jgi:mannose-6-phosphate isomerase-like protein (cupin superfamily)